MNSFDNLYIGSTNESKVRAVKEVFKDFNVISLEVNSDVSSQPLSIEETIQGAINRCKNINKNGLKIGLEAGVSIINDVCYLVNFGALIDDNGNVYTAGGTFIPLPNEVKIMLYNDKMCLKDAFKLYKDNASIDLKNGTIMHLTNGLVSRSDIFENICKLLLGQLYARRQHE